MHKGEDTDFYLNKGFNVVGFEADPELIVFCKNRFKNEIAKKKLIIIEGAIVDRISNNRVKFYKNNVNSVWGTIVPDWSERNKMDKATSEVIYVNEVNFLKRDFMCELMSDKQVASNIPMTQWKKNRIHIQCIQKLLDYVHIKKYFY